MLSKKHRVDMMISLQDWMIQNGVSSITGSPCGELDIVTVDSWMRCGGGTVEEIDEEISKENEK